MGVYFRTGENTAASVPWWFYLLAILPVQIVWWLWLGLVWLAILVATTVVRVAIWTRDEWTRRRGSV